MTVVDCDVPSSSVLDRHLVESAWFRDSYRTRLQRPHAGIVDIFVAIFAHHPWWMKAALIVRNKLAALFGLDVPSVSEIMHPQFKSSYAAGEKIGVWPMYSITENEIVAGRDNKHLDFRLSVLKTNDGEAASVTVSTICMVHNVYGKIYLYFIIPFHKWGVRRLMRQAIIAGRL
jgi:hypothetical protein